MRHLLSLLLLLPIFSSAQVDTYLSAEASLGLGKGLDNTLYGLQASGNVGATDQLYFGASLGALRIAPFLQNIAMPASLRVTFFPVQDEERITGYAYAEGGKIFYGDKNIVSNQPEETKGKYSFFGGVGVQMPSQSRTKISLAAGFSLLGFEKNIYNTENHLVAQQSFLLKRIVVKAGVLLPRLK